MIKTSSLFLFLLWIISLSTNSFALEQVTLQLKWKHQFQFAGYYAAQKMGYFEEEGLEVQINSVNFDKSTSEVVLSGEAQYGISDSSLVLSRLQGRPLVVVAAIFQHSPLVLMTLKSSDILSPLELQGKRVMYQRNIDDAVIRGMFTELGISDQDHTHVPHTFSDDELLTGDVDAMSAYITDQPFYFQEKGIPVTIFSPSSYGIDFYGDMIFVEEQYLKDNKEQVKAFRRASLKGWKYALEHQEEMVDWILKTYQPKKSRDHLLYEARLTARMIQPELVELGYFSLNRFHRIADTYRTLRMAPADSELKGINYSGYLQSDRKAQYWLSISALVLALLSFLALFLWVINHRLKKRVDLRTRELKAANQELENYFDVINQYVITCGTTEKGVIKEVSQAFCEFTGFVKGELIGKSYKMLRHPEDSAFVELINCVQNGKVWVGELQLKSKSGEPLWLHNKVEPEMIDGCLMGFTIVSVDINDKKRVEALSITDALTGLYNRRHFDEVLGQEFQRLKRSKEPLSLLLLDVDDFKAYNDTYGHVKGDECLQKVAAIIGGIVSRPADLAVRYGGEEFAIILPETDLAGAEKLAESLRQGVASLGVEHAKSSTIGCITVSLGVATASPQSEISPSELIDMADRNLYKAKSQGRNCIVWKD